MTQEAKFIEIDLQSNEKALILELAKFYIHDEETKADLNNPRKKWIRFSKYILADITGELCHHYNRCRNNDKSEQLDALIEHLEAILAQR